MKLDCLLPRNNFGQGHRLDMSSSGRDLKQISMTGCALGSVPPHKENTNCKNNSLKVDFDVTTHLMLHFQIKYVIFTFTLVGSLTKY